MKIGLLYVKCNFFPVCTACSFNNFFFISHCFLVPFISFALKSFFNFALLTNYYSIRSADEGITEKGKHTHHKKATGILGRIRERQQRNKY